MVDTELVKSALMKVNKAKCTGLDNIPGRFVRDAAEEIAVPISNINKLSLNLGIAPQDFKNARVVPLYKNNQTKPMQGVTRPCLSCVLYP